MTSRYVSCSRGSHFQGLRRRVRSTAEGPRRSRGSPRQWQQRAGATWGRERSCACNSQTRRRPWPALPRSTAGRARRGCLVPDGAESAQDVSRPGASISCPRRTRNSVPRHGIILTGVLKHTQRQHEQIPLVRVGLELPNLRAQGHRAVGGEGQPADEVVRGVGTAAVLAPREDGRVAAEVVGGLCGGDDDASKAEQGKEHLHRGERRAAA